MNDMTMRAARQGAILGGGLAGGGSAAQAVQTDRSDLGVIVHRAEYQAKRMTEIESGLCDLVERLNGDAPAPRGCAVGNGRSGLLGQAMGSLDDLESALSNCGALLSTLRGLV